MFVVNINQPQFEYDIHALVKAFYPAKTVKVVTPETDVEKSRQLLENLCCDITLMENGGVNIVMTKENKKYEWNPVSGEEQDSVFDAGDKVSYKNGFKLFLYESFSDYTGKCLPWGNLTGIRPTKIAYTMMEDGKDDGEIRDFLEKAHHVSEEKIELSLDIAKREREILSKLHYKDGYSLYVGIPFCPTTCMYCSFTSYPICVYENLVEEYIDCLIKEMHFVAEAFKDKILDTVYIGGGTPTTLQAHQLKRLITALKEIFDFSTVQEFTVEAGRADSITREKLEVLYEMGVSRISVNPQTMKEETLTFIGRRATAKATVEAFKLAREVGFDNINMDIILGLPGESDEDVAETIDKIIPLAPDSLTVHSLAIKRASKLRQVMEQKGVELLQDGENAMSIAAKGAKALYMKPYYLYRQKNMTGNLENVGFACDGKYGIYNILIMEEMQTIAALGAGSISKRVFPDGRIERCDNIKDVALYIEKIEEMLTRKRELFL